MCDYLVAYYPFDGNTDDYSGFSHHGTMVGGSFDPAGIRGSALTLDGAGDHVRVPRSSLLDLPEEFTIATWIRPAVGYGTPDYGHVSLISRWGDNGTGRASFMTGFFRDGRGAFFTYESWSPHVESQLLTPDPIPVETWSHMVGVRRGSTLELHLDGQLMSVFPNSAAPQPSIYDLFIGLEPLGNSPYHGLLDEVRIYDRALSPDEIAALAATVPALRCEGFFPPLASGPVKVRKNRVLPLRAELFDCAGLPMTSAFLISPPVLEVVFSPESAGNSVDVTDDAFPAGLGTEGNQFVFTEDAVWGYNLKTRGFTAPGTYTIRMRSGNDQDYTIDTCEGWFVVE